MFSVVACVLMVVALSVRVMLVQMGMLVIMVLLLTWSAYSAVRLFLTPTIPMAAPAAISSDLARLAAATEARVQEIEERQKLLAAMIASGEVDTDVIAKLGYTESHSANPAQGGPFDNASQSDPTFKSLFTSWKKLDNITDSAIAVPSDKPVKTAEFTSGYGIVNYLTMVFLPVYASEFGGVPESRVLQLNTVAQAAALVLVPIAGWLSASRARLCSSRSCGRA